MGSLTEIFSTVLHVVDRRHCIYADLLRCLSVGSAQSQNQIYVFTAAESVIIVLSVCQSAFLSFVLPQVLQAMFDFSYNLMWHFSSLTIDASMHILRV